MLYSIARACEGDRDLEGRGRAVSSTPHAASSMSMKVFRTTTLAPAACMPSSGAAQKPREGGDHGLPAGMQGPERAAGVDTVVSTLVGTDVVVGVQDAAGVSSSSCLLLPSVPRAMAPSTARFALIWDVWFQM